MEAPFGGRTAAPLETAVELHLHEVCRLHPVVGQGCRRDQEAPRIADRDVAGRALVDAARVHAAAGLHHLAAGREVVVGAQRGLLGRTAQSERAVEVRLRLERSCSLAGAARKLFRRKARHGEDRVNHVSPG